METFKPRVLWFKTRFNPLTREARFFHIPRSKHVDKTNMRVAGITLGTVDNFAITAIGLYGPYDCDGSFELRLINKPMLRMPISALVINADAATICTAFEKNGGIVPPTAMKLSKSFMVVPVDTLDAEMYVPSEQSISTAEFTLVLFGNSLMLSETEQKSAWQTKMLAENP